MKLFCLPNLASIAASIIVSFAPANMQASTLRTQPLAPTIEECGQIFSALTAISNVEQQKYLATSKVFRLKLSNYMISLPREAGLYFFQGFLEIDAAIENILPSTSDSAMADLETLVLRICVTEE